MLKPSILAALVIAAPAFAFAQDRNADSVVATVGGQEITLGQMIVMKQSMQDPGLADMPAQAMWDMMLDQLVRQSAVAAASEGTVNAGLRAQLELQRRNALASETVRKIAESEPTEDEVNAAYARLFTETEPVTEYAAAHILVETEDEAKAIKAELDGGADFGELAEKHSTDNSGPNRGDLGWFTPDQMVEPFAEAVKSLEKGAISDPVQTQFGWHLISLNDTRLREAPQIDEVREDIVQFVRREKVEAEIEEMVSAATVERVEGFDPELLNSTDLLEAQ